MSASSIISMEKLQKSRLSNLKELITTLQLSIQVQVETAAILEDHEQRIYCNAEDVKRLLAVTRAQNEKIASLERRYSEILYRFSEFTGKK